MRHTGADNHPSILAHSCAGILANTSTAASPAPTATGPCLENFGGFSLAGGSCP